MKLRLSRLALLLTILALALHGKRVWGDKINDSPRPAFFLGKDFAVVYETRSGREIQVLRLPPDAHRPGSAALSPDGSKGALLDLGEQLYTFDVATGTLKAMNIQGTWPVRFSVDGKYVACWIRLEKGLGLRVVKLGEPLSWKDVEWIYPSLIRPAEDGNFLVPGVWWKGEKAFQTGTMAGLRYFPNTATSSSSGRSQRTTGEGKCATFTWT
jgi:hypothetical protein